MSPGAMPPIRACSQCELDHGVLDRSDASKSHGLCKRHMLAWIGQCNLSESDIRELTARIEGGNGYPPDLGPVLEDAIA